MIGLLEIHDISIYSKDFEDIFGLNTLSLPETMVSYSMVSYLLILKYGLSTK